MLSTPHCIRAYKPSFWSKFSAEAILKNLRKPIAGLFVLLESLGHQTPKMASENLGVLEETLKPFYQRASQAEDRLARLEAALAAKKGHPSDSANEDYSELINEIQSKLKDACAEIVLEQEKNKKLAAENAKLQYRIHHLVQAVRDADDKLEKKS
ncbi:uncharacterized protein LOC110773072 [Prunus avium]|uniref:Uncharacterized protein LOC110773072 n=1 Tax=Prunus avium TaxID=42229 RepID=A0A6P5TZQ2_PRUAV|nr:uncharacterized protein LOC110773072 [Prunus avium]